MASPSIPQQDSLDEALSPQVSSAIASLYHYLPNSSITADWVTSHGDQLIVRATVHMGTMPVVSAMAMASTIEQAEDQSKLRAIASALIPFRSHRECSNGADELSGTSSSVRPSLSGQPSTDATAQSATVITEAPTSSMDRHRSLSLEEPDNDDDWITAMDTPDSPPPVHSGEMDDDGIDLAPDLASDRGETEPPSMPGSQPTSNPSELPKKTAPKRTSPSKASSSNKLKSNGGAFKQSLEPLSDSPSSVSSPSVASSATSAMLSVDLSDIIAKTSVELKRLGWTDIQGREHLQTVYGKRSRQQLTDPELFDFLKYLESLPT